MQQHTVLPDPRPYPAEPVRRDLLMYAGQIARPTSGAEAKLARGNLRAQIIQMLSQRHTLNLSVAMTMAPDPAAYTALMDATDEVLRAENDDEIQWFALPVVVVAGCKKPAELNDSCPGMLLGACLANYPALRPLAQAQWLPKLLRADDFSQIKPDAWFAAKQNTEAAEAFAAALPQHPFAIPKDQSVHVFYALGYGGREIQAALGQNLREAALPLMQVWLEHFATPGLTLFANPLNPDSPLAALADGSRMRMKMALDVFATNAIRAIRMQSPRVGVVLAAQEGGRLLFGFNAAESAYALQSQIFSWPLSPRDDIALIQQHFLDLMVDCHVENIHQLHDILPENAELPDYASAVGMSGHHPFYSNTH